MAKGTKRSKLKAAISPVRDKLVGSPTKSPPISENSPDDDDLMDDLMAELDSRNTTVQGEAATMIHEIQQNRAVNESPLSLVESPPQKQDSKSRHKARLERKAEKIAASYAPSDLEAEARLEREAKEEEQVITSVCQNLGLEMHEINPDGHCLFSAIADQLSILSLLPSSKTNYATTRHTASQYMLDHPDDFIPFLPSIAGEDGAGSHDDGLMTSEGFGKYCSSIANTGQWGGEPEIQALSRAFGVPIHVVQAATPNVVVHEPGKEPVRSHTPVIISYHRRMYGLGEHYNSLRPKSKGSRLANGIASVLT